MKNLILISSLAILVSACAKDGAQPTCTGHEQMAAATGQPSILVIGDSISIGYTPFVRSAIGNNYDVVHNPCNAMTSTWTLQHIDTWLAGRPSYSAITWNNGLWDVADWIDTPDAEYVANLHAIARKLKAKTTNIIFMTSTEILPGTPNRYEVDVIRKNGLAVQVMAQEGIVVLDLHAVSQTIPQDHVSPTDPHYTPAGYQILANAVLAELNAQFGVN